MTVKLVRKTKIM